MNPSGAFLIHVLVQVPGSTVQESVHFVGSSIHCPLSGPITCWLVTWNDFIWTAVGEGATSPTMYLKTFENLHRIRSKENLVETIFTGHFMASFNRSSPPVRETQWRTFSDTRLKDWMNFMSQKKILPFLFSTNSRLKRKKWQKKIKSIFLYLH